MSAPAFTPGPWTVVQREDDGSTQIHAGPEVVVGGCGCCGSPWMSDEDARLIAAAPELYAELRDLVEAIDAGEAVDSAWTETARAALAKAVQS